MGEYNFENELNDLSVDARVRVVVTLYKAELFDRARALRILGIDDIPSETEVNYS